MYTRLGICERKFAISQRMEGMERRKRDSEERGRKRALTDDDDVGELSRNGGTIVSHSRSLSDCNADCEAPPKPILDFLLTRTRIFKIEIKTMGKDREIERAGLERRGEG